MELGRYLCGMGSVSEALAYIERTAGDASLPRIRLPAAPPRPVETDMKNLMVVPLRHHALLSYLQSRMIDADIGRMFCKEVHYELRQRHYFALAFGNVSGGYEVRNAYYKGCINSKDVSLIPHLRGEVQSCICLFEGFMDFLSYLTLRQMKDNTICIDAACDYLVMNSVGNLRKHWHICKVMGISIAISTMTSPDKRQRRPLPGCMAVVSAASLSATLTTRT